MRDLDRHRKDGIAKAFDLFDTGFVHHADEVLTNSADQGMPLDRRILAVPQELQDEPVMVRLSSVVLCKRKQLGYITDKLAWTVLRLHT